MRRAMFLKTGLLAQEYGHLWSFELARQTGIE
jgi:hypothetical protein